MWVASLDPALTERYAILTTTKSLTTAVSYLCGKAVHPWHEGDALVFITHEFAIEEEGKVLRISQFEHVAIAVAKLVQTECISAIMLTRLFMS